MLPSQFTPEQAERREKASQAFNRFQDAIRRKWGVEIGAFVVTQHNGLIVTIAPAHEVQFVPDWYPGKYSGDTPRSENSVLEEWIEDILDIPDDLT